MASKISENVNSSESWISRSGVVVGYQPEDTMKSFIFNEHNKHSLKLNNDNLMSLITLPQTDINRALELLSSDDESDSSSLTKNTVKNGWSATDESCAQAEMLSDNKSRECEQKVLSWCTNDENDSTSADFSSDLGEQELEKDIIVASNKSFEEILKNKLQQEKTNSSDKFNTQTESLAKPKFSFLRKNNGKAAWCSNVTKHVKGSAPRTMSNDRETVKESREPQTNGASLRRMKSMPSTANKIETTKKAVVDKPGKNVQKTVHFAERSDHETSNETIDTIKSVKNDKNHIHKKEVVDKKSFGGKMKEDVDKELVEFELLEQIANVSMSSTASSIARFDEDMLRERVLKIQKMPPPKSHFQNQYTDAKRTTDCDSKTAISNSKLSACEELFEDLQANSAYDSECEDRSQSSCSNSTTLSHFKEHIVGQSDKFPCPNPSKPNPIRKVSKQNDRQKYHCPSTVCDTDDSWIDESPFEMAGQKTNKIQQYQDEIVHNLPPVKWTFHQSDVSSDDDEQSSRAAADIRQQKDLVTIENIFPNILVDKKQTNPDDNIGVQSAKLKQWVQLLETEIKRFNKENEEIAKIKNEQEQGLKRLEQEMNAFSKHKETEMKEFEEYKSKEMKKIKKERKVFEEYQDAMKNMPNKKDREEIDKLKFEIETLKEEAVNKEARWQSANTRLKQKMEQLETDNSEMHSRIHVLEQKRLQLQAQLISNTGQATLKSAEPVLNKHKPTVTSVSQAVSLKHSNIPIGNITKDDNNSNKYVNSPRIPLQVKKPGNKILQNPSTKIVKAPKRMNPLAMDTGRVDVRGSAASDYYTGEDESNSTDSHQHGTSQATSVLDNMLPFTIPSTSRTVPYSMKINRTNDPIKEEVRHQDGILERVYQNGCVDVIYPNGSLKQISADGKTIIIHLYNGDIKQMTPDGRIVYFYSQDESTQTTFADGTEEILYKNGQKEIIHVSGIREVHFVDQSIKILHPDSREENILPNGLIIRLNGAGDKEIMLPNGQKEIHSNGIKKRIYPDGTTKTVYPDGRQETYYASGRMRVKDRNGNLILDQYIDKLVPTPRIIDSMGTTM